MKEKRRDGPVSWLQLDPMVVASSVWSADNRITHGFLSEGLRICRDQGSSTERTLLASTRDIAES